MGHVPVLLEVGDMEEHRVAELHAFDVVGREVRADRGHADVHDLAAPGHAGLALAARDHRVPVLRDRIELHLTVDDLLGVDRVGVVRLALRREVEEQLHLVAGDVIELRRLRELGAGREIAVLCDLVEREHVTAVRIARGTAGDHEMPDRVEGRCAIDHFERLDVPLHDLGRDEHGGVGEALAVELGVEGAETGLLHFAGERRLVLEHRDALELTLERLVLDRLQHLHRRMDRDHRRELAAGDHELTGRVDVGAMRGLGRREEEDRPGALGGLDLQDARAALGARDAAELVHVVVAVVDRGTPALAGLHARFDGTVVHRRDVVLVVLRRIHLEQRVRLLRVVRREEHPAVRRTLARAGEVVVEAGHDELEGDVHLPRLVGRDEGDLSLEVLLVLGDRHVPVRYRDREARRRDDVLRVGCHERRRVVASGVGDLEDLRRFKVPEIDARYARRVVAVHEEPTSVVVAVGLRQRGVVQVVPRNEAVGGLEHRLGLIGVAPAVLRVLREDGDGAQQTAAREAVHADLSAKTAGEECVEFVFLAGRDIDALCGGGGAGERGRPASGAGVSEAKHGEGTSTEQQAGA